MVVTWPKRLKAQLVVRTEVTKVTFHEGCDLFFFGGGF